ncbi:MAG TPA: D-glycerate dehydrogenase [Candidatus Baltobacteraceae bacterium]|nr:D-glycerate dehydrogenase [Candidatus Baltobacteraceae bacterium]
MSELTAAFVNDDYPSVRALVETVARVVPFDEVSIADGLLCSGALRVDDALLERAPKLRAIALTSVGYDKLDLDACTRRGIPVSNARGSLTEAVADLAFALVLASMRRLSEAFLWAREGKWMDAPPPFGSDLAGKTLGIAGFGDVGRALAPRAQASGMQIVYHNRKPRDDDAQTGARYCSFEELLVTSDCVVALVPLSTETRRMFGSAQFARMKPSAHFVNVGRGALVDTDALVAALQGGTIAGAALDVTDPEPLPPEHRLYMLSNVTIYPHIGSATHETRERMSLFGARNLVAGLQRQPLPAILNPAANYRA